MCGHALERGAMVAIRLPTAPGKNKTKMEERRARISTFLRSASWKASLKKKSDENASSLVWVDTTLTVEVVEKTRNGYPYTHVQERF